MAGSDTSEANGRDLWAHKTDGPREARAGPLREARAGPLREARAHASSLAACLHVPSQRRRACESDSTSPLEGREAVREGEKESESAVARKEER